MPKTVVIDCFPESVGTYRNGYAIVAVDVIRATTTAVTGVALGRKCFPVPSLEEAVPLAAKLPNPLLVGELGGSMPYGFDLNSSPADLESRTDIHRPMLFLSTSGTRLICGAQGSQAMYVACLRNYTAQANYLVTHHPKVAVIGAGSRGEFRKEDQLCCAWIAEKLLSAGYEPEDARTAAIVEQWSGVPVEAITEGASADYLRNSGQQRDLDFILTHIDDLDEVYRFERGQVLKHTEELLFH
ncbi:MAG TPA: 2-phosphosulfolactate phosphatase [Ktedonobacteraceae bacterium]|nr:2-phosphosulfolactate phosphatase [Ktedonobacteraceae bacterium]